MVRGDHRGDGIRVKPDVLRVDLDKTFVIERRQGPDLVAFLDGLEGVERDLGGLVDDVQGYPLALALPL